LITDEKWNYKMAHFHTNDYYEAVYGRLKDAPVGKKRSTPQKIAEELQNGTFPY
jgi:hypothetical protein